MTGADAAPLGDAEFAALMAALEPFEPAPLLAVGVSGGADSVALCLLADRWARARGGAVLALTVDHRLRPESTAEAHAVARRLADRGIRHAILTWQGAKPATGLQEAARAARHRLLLERCREAGALHLLLAHHRDDQAETLLLRLAHGSGPDGLAAMAAVRETAAARLLRPLLTVPKARLVASCRAAGVSWVEDASNGSVRFARGRLRGVSAMLAGEGLDAGRLAETARKLGEARAALDDATAALLGRAAAVDPAGYVRLTPEALARAPAEIVRRALERCLLTVGGAPWPPRGERLARLTAEIADGLSQGRTLAGCRILPYRRHLLIVRELARVEAPLPLPVGETVGWDGRFLVRLAAAPPGGTPVRVGALESDAPRVSSRIGTAADRVAALHGTVPKPALGALPALRDELGLLAVPLLGWIRPGSAGKIEAEAVFMPARPLAPARFAVGRANLGII